MRTTRGLIGPRRLLSPPLIPLSNTDYNIFRSSRYKFAQPWYFNPFHRIFPNLQRTLCWSQQISYIFIINLQIAQSHLKAVHNRGLLNSFKQFQEGHKHNPWLVQSSKHSISFTRSSCPIGKYSSVESFHYTLEEKFGSFVEYFFLFGVLMEGKVESVLVFAYFAFV